MGEGLFLILDGADLGVQPEPLQVGAGNDVVRIDDQKRAIIVGRALWHP